MAIWNPFGKKKKVEEADDKSSADLSESTKENLPEVESNLESSDVADSESSQTSNDSDPPSGPAETETDKSRIAPEAPSTSAEQPEDAPKEKKGFFSNFKQALVKTYRVLNTDIRDLVKEGRLVDDEFLDELFAHLIKTDMGAGPAGKIRDDIKSGFRGRKVFMDDLVSSAKTTIREIMRQESAAVHVAAEGPTVIMVVGVNGSGKTTSIAKLTNKYISEGKSVVLGAGDTFRAAAVQQLTIWSERLGAEIVTGKQGGDPASVAYRAVDAAVKNNHDICIIDTAGRLQTQSNLMDELAKIRRVMAKVIPESPHEVLLVLDSTAGQNAISQARGFSDAAGCTGIILAKLDGTAKGGVAIPIRQEFNLPVKFIGLGETPKDFAEFDVDRYVDALFDAE